jgi:rod shape-determining protein MreC
LSSLAKAGARMGSDTLLEIRSPLASRPVPPRSPEAPELLQAFISRHRPFFTLLIVLVAQVVLLSVQITRQHSVPLARRWAVSAVAPFQRALRGLADAGSGFWSAAHDLSHNEQRVRDLSLRLATDEIQIRDLSQEGAENGRLRALLDLKTRLAYATVSADVIGSSPGQGSNAVVIDKGADAGLVPDLAVITPEGIAGKTVTVYPHTAQVLLISDPAAGAGALVEKTRAQGVLKGRGAGLCRLEYIMNDDAVAAGDLVLTSGLDHIFPKGLALGTVASVDGGNIYKQVVVRPAVALDRLEEVLVVTTH